MKKLFIFGMILVAIASFGGNILSAHAQEVTPAQAAVLEQQLAVLRATLANLELQAGQIPAGEPLGTATASGASLTLVPAASAPAPVISAANQAALSSALASLSGVLVSLQTNIASDPQFLPTHGAAVMAALGGIGSSLALVSQSMVTPAAPVAVTGSNPSGIAQAAPAPVTAQPTQPSAVQPLVSGQTPAATTPAMTAPAAPAGNQTAQVATTASGFGGLNWPLIIVIVLAVAAIALWLWWPSEDEKVVATVAPVRPAAPQPQAPTVIITSSSSGGPAQKASATPLSASQQQQRKTA